jgi:hypothetical protein
MNDELEGVKLLHDTYKHLTTLSSAGIVVVATLLAKGNMRSTVWAVVALVAFCQSNLISVGLMFWLARAVGGQYAQPKPFHSYGMFAVWILFNVALASLGRFAFENF